MRGSKQPKRPTPPADPLAGLLPSALQATHIRAMVLVGGLAGLAFLNSLANGFALDDQLIIVDNLLIRDLRNSPTILSSSYGPTEHGSGLYRPVLIISFALNYALGGLHPFGYHLVNVLLHAGNSALTYALTWQLFRQQGLALLTAAAFALHPIHTEAVANVVGRGELLAAAFLLIAWSLYLERDSPPTVPHRPATSPSPPRGEGRDEGGTAADRWPRARRSLLLAGSVVSFAFALLSKEHAIVLPGLLLLSDGLRATERLPTASRATVARSLVQRSLTVYPIYLGVAGAYLLARTAVLGKFRIEHINVVLNPIAYADPLTRLLTALRVLGRYCWLLLAPVTLSADYSFNQVPIAKSPFELDVLLPIFASAAIAWLLRRRAPAVAFGFLAFLIAILPVSNILLPIGVIMAERLLYLPSFGFCVAVAALVILVTGRLAARKRRGWLQSVPIGGFTILLIFYARETYIRNPAWASDLAIWRTTIGTSPNSAKAHYSLASVLKERGDLEDAKQAIQAALRIFPVWGEAHRRLAVIRTMLGEDDEVIAELQAAIRRDPGAPKPRHELARAYERRGLLHEARRAFERTAELAFTRNEPRFSLGIGEFLVRHEHLSDAEGWFERAIAAWPHFADAHLLLGYIQWKRGRLAKARAGFERALRLDPESAKAHEGLGLIFRSQGREAEARHELELAGQHARREADAQRQAPLDGDAAPDGDRP